MAVGAPRGQNQMWPLYVYDRRIGRKRYIGSYPSEEEARQVEATTKGRFGVFRDPRRTRAADDWQSGLRDVELMACEKAQARGEQLVYFIQGLTGGAIKIGVALRPEHRHAELQYSSPVPLVIRHVMVGGPEKEAELHQRFRDLRLWGEWFRPSPEMSDICGFGDLVTPWEPATDDRPLRRERDEWKDYALGLEAMLVKVKAALDAPLPSLPEAESESVPLASGSSPINRKDT